MSTIVNFTRPPDLDQAEHDRQLQAVAPGDDHRRHQAEPVVSRRPW
jgi:hypothetical protein